MIKFRSLSELEHILSLGDRSKTFILPLNRDGRLGFPITYDEGFRGFIQFDRVGVEGDLFSPIEALPNEGWVLTGTIDQILGNIPEYAGSRVRRYRIDTVDISSSSRSIRPENARHKPGNRELDKFIFNLNSEGEFKPDDLSIVKIIQVATEVGASLSIGWFDSNCPVCLWISEDV